PVTIFHEPINIRAENVARIEAHARSIGVRLKTEVFATRESWQAYALQSLTAMNKIAKELRVEKRLHLWPDKVLGSPAVTRMMPDPVKYSLWIERCWNRRSEWPKAA